MNKNIFISQIIPKNAKKLLKDNGFSVVENDSYHPLSREEFAGRSETADGVISLLSDKIDAMVIERMKNCKVIANYAAGYNNIDVLFAKERGIVVTNTPDVLTEATADLTLCIILSLARRLPEAERFLRERKFSGWQSDLFLGLELSEATVGIVGAGRIGEAVAKRLSAFGCRLLYFSRKQNVSMEKNFQAIQVALEELMARSDVVTIHMPLNAETRNLLNAGLLHRMKPTAYLVNTSRGEVLDENALIEHLREKKIGGAGFDVFTNEPNLDTRLFELPNTILLPHIGSATTAARERMAALAAENVIAVLSGKAPITPV